jgi:RNA recognition motif-containing protein
MATKLFIGNINHNATENDLQDFFASAGTVISVNIIQDRVTGKSRGFGFVEMSTEEEANNAIATLHQKEFQGRALTVNEARPREERSSGGYGYNRGGGGYRDRREGSRRDSRPRY